jgi:hypothetical protein
VGASWRIPRRFWLALLAALVLAFIIICVKALLNGYEAADPESSAAALSPRGVDATVGGPGSPEYNRMIDELNEAGAEEARERGESFVATPTGEEKAMEKIKTEPKASRPVVEMPPQPRGREPESPDGADAALRLVKEKEKAETEKIAALLAELKSLPQPPVGPWVIKMAEKPKEEAQSPKSETAPFKGPRPGDILYAVTSLGINTDVSSPVLAAVAQGPLAGYRLLGDFKRDEKSLSVSFHKIIAPGGMEASIKAVAVDARTSSSALDGRVDTHFLERWGALLSASFLEGLGEAMSETGTAVRSDGELLATEKIGRTMGDLSIEALGQVGSRASNQIERRFDRPPTITLPAGSPIGVLVIESQGAGAPSGS